MFTSPDDYLVDVLIPKDENNLLAGPSGAGKTRWLLNQLLLWEKGEDFLGFKSHPVPWIYIAADRSMKSVNRTLKEMGIDPARIKNKIPAWDKSMNESQILDAIQAYKGHHLVVWESFGSFVGHPQNGPRVKEWLLRTSKFCREHDKTILGIVESPKMKPFERYANPRQRISGAAAWAHFSETIFLVEQEDFDNPNNPDRTLHVCGRNSPAMKIILSFDHQGRLLPLMDEDAAVAVEKIKKRAATH